MQPFVINSLFWHFSVNLSNLVDFGLVICILSLIEERLICLHAALFEDCAIRNRMRHLFHFLLQRMTNLSCNSCDHAQVLQNIFLKTYCRVSI